MPILVVCPGCRKSFNVNEKFAGQKGSCPKCKHLIVVPTAQAEVKVHAPQAFASGGKTTTGELITKPIARTTVQFTPMIGVAIGGGSLVALLVTFVLGRLELLSSAFVIAPLLVLISPPLALAGYWCLRDDELQPYTGNPLYVRVAICGLVYAVLWGVFWAVCANMGVIVEGELWRWLVVLPPFVLVGALAAFASLDLEFGTAAIHYGFYLLVTITLCALGVGFSWVVVAPPVTGF